MESAMTLPIYEEKDRATCPRTARPVRVNALQSLFGAMKDDIPPQDQPHNLSLFCESRKSKRHRGLPVLK